MEAGEALDVLIAEKVMGCKLWKKMDALANAKDQKEYEKYRWAFDYACECPGEIHMDKSSSDDCNVWLKRYSTDISAAWEVVEELKGDYWFSFYYTVEGKWEAMFNAHFPRQNPSFDAESDLAAHSVCLAALKAVGVEIDQHKPK